MNMSAKDFIRAFQHVRNVIPQMTLPLFQLNLWVQCQHTTQQKLRRGSVINVLEKRIGTPFFVHHHKVISFVAQQ